MPKDWEAIRASRPDLTDYVTHFTKSHYQDGKFTNAKDRLMQIINTGYILPTFAPLPNKYESTPNPTVRGPLPAVCLTEQTLWAYNASRHIAARYSGYGVAYHKYLLHGYGARHVLYGTKDQLELLPDELKYLFVTYKPEYAGSGQYPVDFTWEMEWRYRPRPPRGQLPVAITHAWPGLMGGALIVEKDADITDFSTALSNLMAAGTLWPKCIGKIISLETVAREIQAGNQQYARIETYP